MSIAFDSAMKIIRLIPREIALHIGFETPVQKFERIIQDAIDAAARASDTEVNMTKRELVNAIERALNELGVPQPGYPTPVTNAIEILSVAIGRPIRTGIQGTQYHDPVVVADVQSTTGGTLRGTARG